MPLAAPLPDEQAERDRRGAQLVHWLCVPAMGYTGVAAAFYAWVEPRPWLVALNAMSFLAVLANELAFRRHKRLRVAQHVFAGIGVSCLVPMFVTGGVGGAGVVWYFAYLIFAYTLLGPRGGALWSGALVGTTALVLGLGLAPPPYPMAFLVDAGWAFALSVVLVHMLNMAYERSQRRVQERNEQLARAAETKSRLAAIVESNHDAILSHDVVSGAIQSWNAGAQRMFGYTPDEALGASVAMLTPEERIPEELAMRAQVARGEHVDQLETVRIGKDGARVAVALSLSPVRDSRGEVRAVSMIVRDITERQRAQEQARELAQLRAQDEYRSGLLSIVSHELKTPLTPLKLQTHLLESGAAGELNDRQRKSVTLLRRNVDRLAALVQQTLDVSRIEQGRLRIETKPTSLATLVDEVLESYEGAARAAGVTFEVDVGRDLLALADGPRVTQVLFNLVSNAMKFTPPGATIGVRARQEGERVVVRIQDAGPGLSPEQMARLFRPFAQIDEHAAARKEGSGLGLYISKGIVDAHGGEIGCESDGPGHGSTFRFSLPAAQAAPRLT